MWNKTLKPHLRAMWCVLLMFCTWVRSLLRLCVVIQPSLGISSIKVYFRLRLKVSTPLIWLYSRKDAMAVRWIGILVPLWSQTTWVSFYPVGLTLELENWRRLNTLRFRGGLGLGSHDLKEISHVTGVGFLMTFFMNKFRVLGTIGYYCQVRYVVAYKAYGVVFVIMGWRGRRNNSKKKKTCMSTFKLL